MTDFDAATAKVIHKRAIAAFCIALSGFGLAGCETGGSILGGGPLATEAVAQPPAQPAKPVLAARIALAPIIGAPAKVGDQLRTQLTQASESNRIGILGDRDPSADFGMRGYIVAARDRGNVKVSYIWDITDKSGKRVNRITGEESVAGGGRDPWAAVSPDVTQRIANKVATSLGSWAPSQPRPASMPVASSGGGSSPAGAGASTLPRTSGSVASGPTTNTATSSLSGASAIPVVTGAPGDGNTSLASALNRELVRQGLPMDRQTGQPYRVEGHVTLGAVRDGKQSIQIDWRVKDAKGGSVGTVTQKNSIPPGSLDGSWGQTADAAAAAAAQGIVKLLPQQAAKATN